MSAVQHSVLRFGDFELEPTERRLSRRGRVVALTPKVFELLLVLVENAGRVVTKDDLLTGLWPGRFVAESNLTKHVWMLRKALGAPGEDDGCIETVSKVGYRFIAPVVVAEARAPAPLYPETTTPATATGGTGRRPWGRIGWGLGAAVVCALVIAAVWIGLLRPRATAARGGAATAVSVLGFDNLSHDPAAAWVGAALAETLGTEIGLGGRLRVVPDALSAAAAARLPPPGAGGLTRTSLDSLRDRLGADYILRGGYLVTGEGPAARVRVDLTLQKTRDGGVVSLTRSGAVSDLPAMLTQVGADLRRDLDSRPEGPGDLALAANLQAPTTQIMRAMGEGQAALRRHDGARARDAFLEAIAQAPAFAPAYAGLAQAWSALGYQARARAAAEQASAYAADLPTPVRLGILAQRQGAQSDWPGEIATLRRLIALRPGDPEARLHLIGALLDGGKAKEAALAVEGLRAVYRPGVEDPRVDLAAARVAAARDDGPAQAAHASRALAQARANGETGLAAEAEVLLANALDDRDPGKAGQILRQALIDYRQVGNPQGEAWTQQTLGNLLADNDPPAARAAYERALGQYQSIGDLAGAAKVYSDLGIMLWSAGDRDGAETAVNHVLDIRRQTDDPVGQAWALAALAVEQSDQSASEAVIGELRSAIALDTDAGAQAHLGFSLLSLADVQRLRGDLAAARTTCAQAQAVYGRLGDAARRHLADFECAQIALDRGDVAGALAGLAAERLDAKVRGDAMAIGNIDLMDGQIALGLGQPARAIPSLEAARRAFAGAEMVTGQDMAVSLMALAEAVVGNPGARDAAARQARALRGRITEREEVFDADIAMAQLAGLTGDRAAAAAALEALASEARTRHWIGHAFEARLAALQVLDHAGGARAEALRRSLTAEARRAGFGWIVQRIEISGRERGARPSA